MPTPQSFFNTIGLPPEQASQAVQRATTQEAIILEIFADMPTLQASCSQLLDWGIRKKNLNKKTPITSIRRAVNVLCKKGALIKLPKQVKGSLGMPEYLFGLNPSRL